MSLHNDIRLLSQLPLFTDMGAEQIRLIAFGADRRHIATGQVLFREGSPAECAYAVVRGRVELYHLGRDGQPVLDMAVGEGVLLSELALVTLVERKYTAVAAEDSEVIRITRALFHRLMEEYPDAARVIENRIRDNILTLARRSAAMLDHFL